MPNKPLDILFLFSELSYYFLSSLNGFTKKSLLNIHVVHWPVNPNAPFQLKFSNSINFHPKSDLNISEIENLIESINPSIIFTSGWIDKDYIKVLKAYKKKNSQCTSIIGLDNPWRGTIKQKLSSIAFKKTLKNSYDYAWVPGDKQVSFANKLGFNLKFIKKGFYSADVNNFTKAYKNKTHSKRLIFAGRYAPEKGILELLQAFKNLEIADWELHCIGTGPLRDQMPEVKGVKHYGFVQPSDLPSIMKEGGVFILPSKFEPWGVVVHEFAAAGFPMVLSDQVGSAEVFLEEGVNGYTFSWQKESDLENTLHKIMSLPEDQLIEMGKRSHEFAQRITPELWANTLMEIIEETSNVRN